MTDDDWYRRPPGEPGRPTFAPPAPPLRPERSIGRRVAAGFIDLVPLGFVFVGFAEREKGPPGQVTYRVENLDLVIVLGLFLAYYFVSEAITGTTFGKWIVGLVVVNEGGGAASIGKVAGRTLMRLIDVLPVLYLVGFISMLVSPRGHRLGDMAAHTTVKRREAGRSAMAGVLLFVIAGGAIGFGMYRVATREDPDDQLGRFDYAEEVVPLVDRVMTEGIGADSADAIVAMMPAGDITVAEIRSALDQISEQMGEWSGEYEIGEHEVIRDVSIEGFGTHDVMLVSLDTDFEVGATEVQLAFFVVGGELRLLRFDVFPP